ncbi:MAG: ABC transporter permease [Muribaculaceae bacterium]|nr:ABC transporter permease [Muribaculaceae bacterium]
MQNQIWQTIRHNKLFAAIYIFGTALALASTTVAVVILNSMVAPVYPEYDRLNTAFLQRLVMDVEDGNVEFAMSYDLVRDHIYKLENARKVSAYIDPWEKSYATPADGGLDFPVKVKYTDPAFFDVYAFRFLAGKPFSDAEFEAGMPLAVIGEKTARQTFGAVAPDECIGRTVSIDFTDYRVVGVVREATPAQTDSYAGVYVPYTSRPGYDQPINGIPWIGRLHAVFVTDDIEALKTEVAALADRFNAANEVFQVHFLDQPMSHAVKTFRRSIRDDGFKISGIFLVFALVVMALLLIPSLNLSGIISGHMETRMSEMGLRKSFGATRSRLLRDVLSENVWLTFLGGIVGYFFAYMMLKSGVADLFTFEGVETDITDEMIFSPVVFVSVFLICIVLNTLSGLLPVYRSLGRPVVESLNEK